MEWVLRVVVPFLLLMLLVRLFMPPRFGRRGPIELMLIKSAGDIVAQIAFDHNHSLEFGLRQITL